MLGHAEALTDLVKEQANPAVASIMSVDCITDVTAFKSMTLNGTCVVCGE